jgi:hypothetical protein
MSQSDYYLDQVESRKHEDASGRWWIDPSGGSTPVLQDNLEGPYTEDEIDAILWPQALAGDFIPGV